MLKRLAYLVPFRIIGSVMPQLSPDTFLTDIGYAVMQPNLIRTLVGVMLAVLAAYWVGRFVAVGIVRLAQLISVSADNAASEQKTIQLRRVETYLSILTALIRVAIVVWAGYFAWKQLAPPSSGAVYAIGAGAFVAVATGATVGMLLRDVTAGAVMIIERWFHVGDFIRVEPFGDVGGVVEQVTLRSTKLRNLNGEVIYLHNQHIQAVKVTPRGLRRIAVDIFVNNAKVGRGLIEKAIETLPLGTIKVAQKPEIVREEALSDHLYLFTVVGETAPGREWLIENFFIETLREIDERRKGPQTLVRPPIARYSDLAAEQSFRKAVRSKRSTAKP
jgi:small-conductance mechanosensitive channel